MAFAPVFAAVGDNRRDVYGATEIGIFDIQFSAADTYVTGGLALTSANFGLSRPLLAVEVMGGNTAAVAWNWFWNTQTGKLMMLASAAGVAGTAPNQDATAATAMTNFTVRVIVTTQR